MPIRDRGRHRSVPAYPAGPLTRVQGCAPRPGHARSNAPAFLRQGWGAAWLVGVPAVSAGAFCRPERARKGSARAEMPADIK